MCVYVCMYVCMYCVCVYVCKRCDKKYGECLNKKFITVKDTLPLIPLK